MAQQRPHDAPGDRGLARSPQNGLGALLRIRGRRVDAMKCQKSTDRRRDVSDRSGALRYTCQGAPAPSIPISTLSPSN